jgi:hypothetical protein
MRFLFAAAALFAAGCNLVNKNDFSVPYAFQPQEYSKSFGDAMGTFPQIACNSGMSDSCAQAAMALPPGSSLTASCDSASSECRATAEMRLSYPVNLSMQSSFPQEAIQFGINFVDIRAIKYWVVSNTVTVQTPAIDLYVAPGSAKDESEGTRVGSLAPLSPKSAACADPVDSDEAAGGAMVCSLPLDENGKAALANFAKDYKNEFQIIAHGTVAGKGGDPIPAGTIDFVVRPVIEIGIVR